MQLSGIADEAGKPIETQIAAHKELGWGLIEVRQTAQGNLTEVSDEEFERVLGLVTDAGLRISCFASQIGNWARKITGDFEIDRADLARSIPRMQKAGTKYIRIMTWMQGDASPQEWRAEALRRVAALVQMAEDGGIVIAHENCSGWASESPANTLEMIETVDSLALALIYDTANALSHGQDTWAFLQALKDHIAYVHIMDWTVGPDGKGHGVYPGEGQCRLREQLVEIFRTGYDGVFSIEPHIAAIIHRGQEAGDADAAYKCYLEYGRRFVRLAEEVRRGLR